MAVGKLLAKLKGNPLEKVDLRQLREEELRFRNQLDSVRKSIDNNEKDKKKKFREGVGADQFKKRMLAQEIQALDTEAKLNLKNFTTANNQLKFVKNLLIMKNHEQQLKETGIWKKFTSIPREQLETYLIKLNLDGKDFNGVVNELNRPFEMDIAAEEGEIADEEKSLFESWDKVESGGLEPEQAESEISIDKEMSKEEE